MKFNLGQILAAVAIVGATIGVLQNPNEIVTSLVSSLCGLRILLSCGLAVSGAIRLRYFFRGYAVVSLLYFCAVWGVFGDLDPERMLTSKGIDVLYSMMPAEDDVGSVPSEFAALRATQPVPPKSSNSIPYNYYVIGHSIICVLLAWLIGDVCQWSANKAQREND